VEEKGDTGGGIEREEEKVNEDGRGVFGGDIGSAGWETLR